MRAKEFIYEGKNKRIGKLDPHQKATMSKTHKFSGFPQREYDLNRAMMTVGASDGDSFPHFTPDEESWVGRYALGSPYTEEEHKMLHHTYKHLKAPIVGVVNHGSQEPSDTYKVSPLAKPKRNKYGV